MPLVVAPVPSDLRGSTPSVVPRYTTSLVNRVEDAWWEWRLGIRTTGAEKLNRAGDAHRYGYLAYHTYFSIFDALQLRADDVVVDLGCGKGRVVCIAALYPILQAVGVEIDPLLYTECRMNAGRMRRRQAPIRCECMSATDFDYDAATVLTLFHPFGAATLQAVLGRVEDSLRRRPRELRLVYINPVHAAVTDAKPWLVLEAVWTPSTWSRLKFPVLFYRSRSADLSR